MAITGSSDSIMVNGYNLAPYVQKFEISYEMEEIEYTVLDTDARQYIQGAEDVTLDLEGVFDADATDGDRIHDVLSAAFADRTENIISLGIGTAAAGGTVILLDAVQTKYTRPVEAGALLVVQATFRGTGGSSTQGYALHVGGYAAGTHNSAAVVHGSATTNGATYHAQRSGGTATDVDVKWQHSVGGGVWVDLTGATLNNLNTEYAAGSGEIASGVTINTEVRAVVVITGGSVDNLTTSFARG